MNKYQLGENRILVSTNDGRIRVPDNPELESILRRGFDLWLRGAGRRIYDGAFAGEPGKVDVFLTDDVGAERVRPFTKTPENPPAKNRQTTIRTSDDEFVVY